MNPIIQLIAGSFLLGLLVAYAMWVRVRVIGFREDLFAIRDRLWDQMLRAGKLDHPSHREARDVINSLIRLAPRMSIFMIRSLARMTPADQRRAIFTDLAEAEAAISQTIDRLARFVIFEQLSGWAYLPCLIIKVKGAKLQQAIESRVRQVLDHTQAAATLSHFDEHPPLTP